MNSITIILITFTLSFAGCIQIEHERHLAARCFGLDAVEDEACERGLHHYEVKLRALEIEQISEGGHVEVKVHFINNGDGGRVLHEANFQVRFGGVVNRIQGDFVNQGCSSPAGEVTLSPGDEWTGSILLSSDAQWENISEVGLRWIVYPAGQCTDEISLFDAYYGNVCVSWDGLTVNLSSHSPSVHRNTPGPQLCDPAAVHEFGATQAVGADVVIRYGEEMATWWFPGPYDSAWWQANCPECQVVK